MGKCQAKRKDGTGCTNLVNRGTCEYCAYHVKKAYQAMSGKRTDLQSTFSGTAGVRARIMGRVDPKGNFFAGGRAVNPISSSAAQSGRGGGEMGGAFHAFTGSQKHRAKDAKALAELGAKRVDKALEMEERQKDALAVLSRNGKTTFKSHLSQAERNTVKTVAREVSAELGMKLLAQTPGARGLIRTLSKDTKSQSKETEEDKVKEKTKKKDDEKSAKQLLFDHKQKLAEERARKVLYERQMSATPQLGKGFSGSGFIDLNKKSNMSSSAAKAKALLALKGKTLESKNPNYVPSRKRKAEEVESQRKKVAAALDVDRHKQKENNGNAKEEETAQVTTSSGKVMTKERLAAICGAKSKNEHLVDEYANEAQERHFDTLEKKEAMEDKMVNTKELETKAVSCKECGYTSYAQSQPCRDRGHQVKRITATKKFFECVECKSRTVSLDRYPKSACSKCGSSKWARAGMSRERKGPTLDSERLSIRGAEEKFLGQTLSNSDLHL